MSQQTLSVEEAKSNNQPINLSLLFMAIFSLICISTTALHYVYATRFSLEKPELIAIGLFNFWLLLVSLIDIKYKEIPLWLTAPIIIGAIVYRLFPLDLVTARNAILGLNLYPFDAALGICFGFITVDMITHFGNWLAKFPHSSQGLLPIWISIIPIALSMFVPIYPLWLIPVVIISIRALAEFGYSKNENIKKSITWMCTNAAITYVILFTMLFAIGYAFLYNRGISSPTERIHLVVFVLCFSFILEEVLVPSFQWIVDKIKSKKQIETDSNQTLQKTQAEEKSVLGGGDAMLTAAIGGLWGAVVVNNCLLMAFVVALIIFAFIRLLGLFFKSATWANYKSSNAPEVPFAPFIVISAQIILFAEIMIRSPQSIGTCAV